MAELIVPPSFAEHIADLAGAEGKSWVAALPALAEHYRGQWSLTFDGDPLHGYAGVVQPVRRADGTPAMLKLSWPDEENLDEPVALAAWSGDGAVRLLDADAEHRALLLERLDPDRMLTGEPIDDAVAIAGELLRRLSVPAPPLARSLRAEAERWAAELPADWERMGRPVPVELLDAAVEICRRRGPLAGNLLVNEDLHYENVLAGGRQDWLVIDPKPVAGDPEFGVIPLLWNRIDELSLDGKFAAIVAAGRLDTGLAREWTLVRAVVNWLWAVEDEEDDPEEDWLYAGVVRIAGWAAGEPEQITLP